MAVKQNNKIEASHFTPVTIGSFQPSANGNTDYAFDFTKYLFVSVSFTQGTATSWITVPTAMIKATNTTYYAKASGGVMGAIKYSSDTTMKITHFANTLIEVYGIITLS